MAFTDDIQNFEAGLVRILKDEQVKARAAARNDGRIR